MPKVLRMPARSAAQRLGSTMRCSAYEGSQEGREFFARFFFFVRTFQTGSAAPSIRARRGERRRRSDELQFASPPVATA